MFTLNNPRIGDEATLLACVYEHSIATYVIFQEEWPEGGTRHYQGYMELVSNFRVNALKTRIGLPRIHLELRRGSQAQAIAYCKKDESSTGQEPYEAGEPRKGRGRPSREDNLDEAVEAITEGATLSELANEFPKQFVLHKVGLQGLLEQRASDRDWPMEILILYGPSGTGKSMTARNMMLEGNCYWGSWPTGGRWWWPGYEGQHTVILDEFRHQVSMDQMLNLMDRYPYKIEYKYGNTTFRSKKLVITTNISPEMWYPKVEDVSMLRRRIKEFATIYEYGELTHVVDLDGDSDMETDPIINRRIISLADRPDTCGNPADRDWGTFARAPSAEAGGRRDGSMFD